MNSSVPARERRWLPLSLLLAGFATYYWIFFLPPRLVGASEPDRYYHLGLSRLLAEGGLLRVLPQVEDLNWGRYFPDKEFLFHALTGLAWKLGGETATMLVVPLLGLAIAATLYFAMPRALSGARAATIIGLALLFSAVFLFRLTLLRPHLAAILCFCVLLAGIVRNRGWVSALGAAGFALSYHALYLAVLPIAVAAFIPWPERRHRRWLAPAAGLVVGVLINPYFPGSVVIGWQVLKLALGIDLPPYWLPGAELQATPLAEYLAFFGFLPLLVALAAVLSWKLRARLAELAPERVYLFALTALLVLLSVKSARAIEYAIPCAILLAGHLALLVPDRRALAAAAIALVLVQGNTAWIYFNDIWYRPQGGNTGHYFEAIAKIPAGSRGAKVFNCEWEAGSYLLYARPDLRFVDLLEPALLWQVSHEKYAARLRLIMGIEPQPYAVLRNGFHADYVLCAKPRLDRQLQADPAHFERLAPAQGDLLNVYRVR